MEPLQHNKSILVATDFSQVGDHALKYASKLVRQFSGKIILLHVLNDVTKKRLKKENKDVASVEAKLKEETEQIKRVYGIDASYILREGSIFTTIAEVAREVDALYLVIGTHGKKGIQFLMGSFIMKVIKRSPVPAFAIQEAPEKTDFKHIIYPLDASLGSKQKVKWAVHFNKLIGAHYHIFVEDPGLNDIKLKLRADLKLVTKIMDQHGIGYTVSYATGKGTFDIQTTAFAVEKQADFVMVSTDPGKITWALFGSSDEKLIYNKERIPVMCINAKDMNVIIGGM